jgi:cellulose synthase/poly-beta-1,6-N-acetylglucosamine synthase-like glycosyltransferase
VADPIRILAYFVFGMYVLTAAWLLLNGLVQLHLLWHYKRANKRNKRPASMTGELPFVSIQIPVYNEKYVIGRLMHKLAALDYPKDKFEIQVLDDSTDETSEIIDVAVQHLHQSGVVAQVLRRPNRKGYKAGALQAGMAHCKGNLIAIFDADFTPDPQFLNNMVPYFADPGVGLAQARWGHLNKEQNHLTRIQTFLLDTHFSVEQTGRSNAGYFINFCGTAGIWRKECIEDAGGWDGNVLSEDLDLSYRAQMKGWKLVYDQEIEVPAELPSVIEAFKVQQFRWTKGMAQSLRKNVRALLAAALPIDKKLHGIFHLLSSFLFVCLLVNALLTVPLLVFRNMYPEIMEWSKYTVITGLNLVALTFFYYNGACIDGKGGARQFFRHYPIFLVVYMGLSVQNTCAVLQGFLGSGSEFVRTPKMSNAGTNNAYLERKISWVYVLEVLIFCYFIGGIGLSFYFRDYFLLLFFSMIGMGLGYIVFASMPVLRPVRLFKVAS